MAEIGGEIESERMGWIGRGLTLRGTRGAQQVEGLPQLEFLTGLTDSHTDTSLTRASISSQLSDSLTKKRSAPYWVAACLYSGMS